MIITEPSTSLLRIDWGNVQSALSAHLVVSVATMGSKCSLGHTVVSVNCLHDLTDLRLVWSFGAYYKWLTEQVFGFFVKNLGGGTVDYLYFVIAVAHH
jgi:hypothetical protein